jgi:hypothetical protein
MNKYLCLCRNRKIMIQASNSEQAQAKAVKAFQKRAGGRKVKSSEVVVIVAEFNGKRLIEF